MAVHGSSSWTGDKALARLKTGNARFVAGKARFPTVQKAVLADELRSMHYAAIDDMALGIRKSVDGAFIPIRDGL